MDNLSIAQTYGIPLETKVTVPYFGPVVNLAEIQQHCYYLCNVENLLGHVISTDIP